MAKKVLVVLFITAMLLVGCSKTEEDFGVNGTLVCTKVEIDKEGLKTTEELQVTYKIKKVTNVNSKIAMEAKKDTVDVLYSLNKEIYDELNKINGISAKTSKVNDMVIVESNINYSELDIEALNSISKETFNISKYENNSISINDFKATELQDYNCQ